MTTPIKVVVCCDADCINYNVAQEIPLTAEEIAANEAGAIQAETERAALEAEAATVAAAKEAAHAKLQALGLTAEEIAALSK